MKLLSSLRMTSCLITLVSILGAQTPTSPKNPNPDLVNQLCSQLNVTPAQATGGAGAIFAQVKSHLSAEDFSKVAAAVPGMSGFLNAAPAAGGSMAGSVAPSLPGTGGSLTSLAGSFQSLGLSPSMAGKFVPILQNYVGSKGGSGVASLFSGALK
jgi:hypothetical protein